jgi:hypothetical protein
MVCVNPSLKRQGNSRGTAWEQQGNGMGTAWERHGMWESALTVPIQQTLRTEEGNTSLQFQPHFAISAWTVGCFDDQPRFGPAADCAVSSVANVEVRHTFV